MARKVTIFDAQGLTQAETVVADDDSARRYERLPFESDNVSRVDVTDTDD